MCNMYLVQLTLYNSNAKRGTKKDFKYRKLIFQEIFNVS